MSSSFPITALPFQPSTPIVAGTAFPSTFLGGEMRCTAAPFVAPPILPASGVAGTGATVSGRVVNNGSLFIATFLGFNLQNPAPTPEPATLVLVGAALAGGLGAAAPRRRSASRQEPRI